jgi:DNA gyrase/topoisomerase IV subunit A
MTALIMKIADLVKEEKIVGIKDLRDESDKEGVRVVIELKKDAYPQKVLNALYSMTDLQKNFNVNMLALVDGVLVTFLLPETRKTSTAERKRFHLLRGVDNIRSAFRDKDAFPIYAANFFYISGSAFLKSESL